MGLHEQLGEALTELKRETAHLAEARTELASQGRGDLHANMLAHLSECVELLARITTGVSPNTEKRS